jgi:propionyl-CoA synthetase
MSDHYAPTYAEIYQHSIAKRDDFWMQAAAALDWHTAPTRAIDEATQHVSGQWFPDGVLNTSYNALDRHVVAGHGERAALIYDSAMTGTRKVYSYRELLDEVARLAGAMTTLGVITGDRVVIYLPMIPEAVIAMLACARIGAIHSVVFGGFAAAELAARIDDAQPRVLLTASGGLEPGRIVEYLPTVAKALLLSASPPEILVVKDRDQVPGAAGDYDGWRDWDTLTEGAEPVDAVPVAATHPLYILYTSGTAGKPKGVVRDHGGHAVALNWSMKHIYDIGPAEVMWAASDVGWVVGHSYIVYGPLLAGATTVMYEGKPVDTPDAGAFWRIAAEYRVKVLFTAPTALRAIRKADPHADELAHYDLPRLETLFAAGERLDPDTYHWATTTLSIPVIDHWWQTETGWAVCANPRGIETLPVKAGSPSVTMPGFQVEVLDAKGDPVPAGTEGYIVIALPLPPGTLSGLWRDDDRFHTSYLRIYPGYYSTGDSGYLDDDGYLFVLGRSDDVINVAGHRLTTGVMESILAAHPAVAENAVIGIHDDLKGQRPSAYVVPTSKFDGDTDQLRTDLIAMVRDELGPVAAFRDVTVIDALPKTRSGKILRRVVRQIAEGKLADTPSTIEDPAVLTALINQLR